MLCGRLVEISRIDRLLSDARSGRSGVLTLRGEAGIGKTSLLGRAEDTARELGMSVLAIRGWEQEHSLAFAGLAQLVHPAAHLIRKLPERQARALSGAVALGPTRPVDRFAVYTAALGLLAQISEDGPVLLTVDDAHALDTPSAEALAFVARRLMAEGVAVLATARPHSSVAWLTTHLPVLNVTGLAAEAVDELIVDRTGTRPTGAVLRHLLDRSAGNPMALIELLSDVNGHQLAGQQPMPAFAHAREAAGALFSRRVRALGDPARSVLLLLATSISAELRRVLEAAEAQGLPESALAEAESCGLVVFESGTFRFTHPLASTAVLAGASATERRAAHRVLAAVCPDSSHVGERAWHLAEGTLGADEQVAAELEKAADIARGRSGYAAAVTLLERAAALGDSDSSRSRRLFAAAGDAFLAGQTGRARELLTTADALSEDPHLRASVAAGRGRVEALTGHPKLGYRIVFQAALAVRDTDAQRCAGLLADSAMAALLAGDPGAAVDAALEAQKLVDDPSGNVALVINLVHGLTLLHLGQALQGRERLQACTTLVERPTDSPIAVEYMILAAIAMNWIGEHALARRTMDAVLSELRVCGALGMMPFALYALAYTEVLTGRTASARATANEAVKLAEFTNDEVWHYLALSSLTYVEAIRGDADQCRRHGRQAMALRRSCTDYPRDASEALGLLELSLGQYEDALSVFHEGARSTPSDSPDALVSSHFDYIEAHVRSGRRPTGRMLGVLDDHAQNSAFPAQAAIAWRLRGLVADDTSAGACFDAALRLHSQVECPLETARTRLAFGERLRRSGQRVKAREQLRTAVDAFDRLDARVWAERARKELAATGETVRRPRTAGTLADLTPQEYQVAQTVVRGSTNRETASSLFLSTKTVEFHLGNVYRKLGVRNRTELAHSHPSLRD